MIYRDYAVYGIIVVIILLVIGYMVIPYFTQDSVILTVTDKTATTQISSDCDKDGCSTSSYIDYMIYSDNETLENIDNIFIWKFDSSDIYGKIDMGDTYKFRVYGWRIPILGMYRNVISVQTLSDAKVSDNIKSNMLNAMKKRRDPNITLIATEQWV
jgi:hypothetical protein